MHCKLGENNQRTFLFDFRLFSSIISLFAAYFFWLTFQAITAIS